MSLAPCLCASVVIPHELRTTRVPIHHRGTETQRGTEIELCDFVIPSVARDDSCASRDSAPRDRKSTRLNSSHVETSYAVFCLKKKRSRKGFSVSPPASVQL